MNSNIGLNEAHDFDWHDLAEDVVVPEQAAIAMFVNPLGKVVIRQAGQHHPDEDTWIVFAPEHAAAVAEAILGAAGIHDAEPIKAAIPKPGDGRPTDRVRSTGVSRELKALLLKRGFLSRLDVLIDHETLDRLRGAASRASKSPSQLIADMVRAAFPSATAGMNRTVPCFLDTCVEDLLLLDHIAAAAGKTRDVVVSDIVFHVLTDERQLRKRMEDREAQHGTHSDCQA